MAEHGKHRPLVKLATLLSLLWAASLFWAGTAQAACRQALVLALDVSGSVDGTEYRLQLDGLANALDNPEVQRALFSMPAAPVALAIFEWSGPDVQRLLLDWLVLTSPQDLAVVTAKLRATTSRKPGDPSTGLGAAMLFGNALLNKQGSCWKRTLDISGDGESNTGPRPQDVRASGAAQGIIINGLVIGANRALATGTGDQAVANLSDYYRALVIQGADAFVETAVGFEDFEAAMTRKLLREVEGLVLGRRQVGQ